MMIGGMTLCERKIEYGFPKRKDRSALIAQTHFSTHISFTPHDCPSHQMSSPLSYSVEFSIDVSEPLSASWGE